MINILLVDDHPIVLQGLSSALKSDSSINIVDKAVNRAEVFSCLRSSRPGLIDLIILDLNMGDDRGQDIARSIKQKYPDMKILIFTSHSKWAHIQDLLQIGINGYVMKEEDDEVLINAVYSIVEEGKDYFGKGFKKKLKEMESFGKPIKLSKREIDVLRAICAGKKKREIAEELSIQESTVNTYHKRLKAKTNSNTNADIIDFGKSQGYC
ncbi:MAG: response regulator transcription factor [Bacteroidia bacterium]|nr:response regulator transcription factor [Bacteroidia bacterium]